MQSIQTELQDILCIITKQFSLLKKLDVRFCSKYFMVLKKVKTPSHKRVKAELEEFTSSAIAIVPPSPPVDNKVNMFIRTDVKNEDIIHVECM